MGQPVAGRRSAEGREAGEVTVRVRVAAAAARTKESPPAVALPAHFEAPKMVSLLFSKLLSRIIRFCKKKKKKRNIHMESRMTRTRMTR